MDSKASSLCMHFLLIQLLSGTVLSVHWPVKSLPGYSGDLPFNLETGYISVDGIEFFYYFVESEGNPGADPVLLYLNGGPGCSGLNGLFYQIGPLKFNISDYTGSLPTLMYEPETWTKTASIIFLDAPVGAGFSYANDSGAWTTADAQAASQYNDFLRSWIDEHPDFDTNPVYIGSDSYAGINLPILAQDIINSNEAGGEPTIYLKGMVLSCPHTNTDIEANARLTFAHRMALISDSMYESAKNSCNGDYVDTTTAACTESLSAITQCIAEISLTSPLDPDCTFLSPKEKEEKEEKAARRSLRQNPIRSSLSLPSSITNKQADFYCHNFPYLLLDVWGNYEGVQEALHVRPETVKIFFRCNVSLSYTFDTHDAVAYHKNLTETGLQLLVFIGDHDMSIPHNGIEYWISTLDLTLDTDWRPWFVDGQVAGYTRRYTNDGYRLTYATIKVGYSSPMQSAIREDLNLSLAQFLHKSQSTTMLGIINEHINFQVSPGQPSSITDDAEAVTLTGASQESANQINQKEIHWGNADVVFVCEMIIDIVKHLFIAKFNDIKPFAYSEFLEGPMQAEWDWRFERWKCGTRT